MENKVALIRTAIPNSLVHWEITVACIRTEEEGPLFESMQQYMQAISWMAGIAESAPLRSAILFQVTSVRPCEEESLLLAPAPEAYGDLLQVLAQTLHLKRTSYWRPRAEQGPRLQLLASRGVAGAGTNKEAFEPMSRLAALAALEYRIVRLRNIRSQVRYVQSIHAGDEQASVSSPGNFLAFPILAKHQVTGVVCCEEIDSPPAAFDRLEDDLLLLLGHRLGEALSTIASVPEHERIHMLQQALERARLEWSKSAEPFHTVLSAREQQVATHVAKGLTNGEIAKSLFISPRTVTTHLERIFQKLDVSSRAALTRYIIEKGLMSEDPGQPLR